MEDFRALAQTSDTSAGDTALPVTYNPSATYLNERQALRVAGDQALLEQLINRLSPAAGQALSLPSRPVPIAEHSLLGQWCKVFIKAINGKGFIAWARAQGFDLNTLRLQGSTLRVRAHGQLKVLNLADASAWWALANPIIYICHVVDPMTLGWPYIDATTDMTALTLPLNLTLAFHGLPVPANRLQALTLVEELRALQDFPGFDSSGRSTSSLYAELREQARDYLQLADVLRPLAEDQDSLSGLDIYRRRLQLTSDSRLARHLKEAAALLQAINAESDPCSTTEASGSLYFDYQRKRLCVAGRDDKGELEPEVAGTRDARWHRLAALSEQLHIDIYPDQSLSVAAALHAYAIAPPLDAPATTALAQRLRQWPAPAVPVVLSSARAFTELYYAIQYVGLLNDHFTLCSALAKLISGGVLQGPDGLGMFISGDPDTLQALVNKACARLRVLTDDPAFLAIRRRERIAPSSHVLLEASGSVGAIDLDGNWKLLTDAVMNEPDLATLLPPLKKLAAKTGGDLRTNGLISLGQALTMYKVILPDTLPEARQTLRRLELSPPFPPGQDYYWRALKPLDDAQPSAWKLLALHRQPILTVNATFMAGQAVPLFEYLGRAGLAGKSVADVRAEADFLMVRLLASPLAQQLGEALATALQWHGNRNGLILAALILSLDPQPQAHPTRLNYFDWHDADCWGEPVSFVRYQIEVSLQGLSPLVAALAAHLVLCEKSPQLLVRDLPEITPYLSSQAWVLLRHRVAWMEQVVPGSSRLLNYEHTMTLANFTPENSWKAYLAGRHAKGPILDWAVANGVLAPKTRHDALEFTRALTALNGQRARLTSTLQAFAKPIVTLRQTALEDLRRVYPDNNLLETPVLMWLPEHSPFSEEGQFEGVHTGPKYSFVDLHMAASLDITSNRWHSSNKAIKYREMAKRFYLLGQINGIFANAFNQKLEQLQAAYGESIRCGLADLTLPRREALEYGEVQFFTLSRPSSRADTPAEVGRLGILVYVTYYSDEHLYEFFPRQLLIRPRRDIDYAQLMHAVKAATPQPWMRFDWPAYAHGAKPAEIAATAPSTDLLISRLNRDLPAATDIPAQDALGRRVPRTFDSARSKALTRVIIEHHLLHDGLAWRTKARLPITLQAAASGRDPWAEYLRDVALILG